MKGKEGSFFTVEVYQRDICHFSQLKDQNEISQMHFMDVRDKKTCFSDLFIL